MNFKASFCDPLNPEIIDLGDIPKDKIMETFEKIPWKKLIQKMKKAKEDEIHYSPSLEIENKENKNVIIVSAMDEKEWYIFFKRPMQFKSFFGLIKKVDPEYITDKIGQTIDDVKACINALINNNLEFLEEKFIES
jgi:hypothetical protein